MANPFYINPNPTGVNIGGQLAQLGQTLGNVRRQDEQKQQQQQATTQLQQAIASGDPDRISDVVIANPNISEQQRQAGYQHMGSIQKHQQDAQMQSTFKLLAEPQNGHKIMADHISDMVQQGATKEQIQPYLHELSAYDKDPKAYMDDLNIKANISYPQQYKSFKAMTQPKIKFEQGAGDMAGYAFNPDTGTFKTTPSAQQQVAAREQVKDDRANLDAKLKSQNNTRLRAETLFKDFSTKQKTYYTMQTAHENILSALKVGKTDPTGTSDIALLYQYNHLLDPTSVVREGEFATAQKSAGMSNEVYNLVQQVNSGKLLTPEQRKSILNVSNDHMKRMQTRYNQDKAFTKNRAKAWGIPEDMVFPKDAEEAGVASAQTEQMADAPEAAVQYLKQHPETKDQFKAQFGYLPEE